MSLYIQSINQIFPGQKLNKLPNSPLNIPQKISINKNLVQNEENENLIYELYSIINPSSKVDIYMYTYICIYIYI
jgi:hypothetical protein